MLGAAAVSGLYGAGIGGAVGGIHAYVTGGNIFTGIGIGAASGFAGAFALPFAIAGGTAGFAALGFSSAFAASAGLFSGSIFAGAASGAFDAWLRNEDPVTGAVVGGFSGIIGSAIAKAVGPSINRAVQKAPELTDDLIQSLNGKEVLVLGRFQKVVDELADDLQRAGVNATTVTDPSKKFLFLKVIEEWTDANPTLFKETVRDIANYAHDAARIASSPNVLQNSFDWTRSGYTILETIQLNFWKNVKNFGGNIGPEEIIQFYKKFD